MDLLVCAYVLNWKHVLKFSYTYSGVSKVLWYFGNVRANLSMLLSVSRWQSSLHPDIYLTWYFPCTILWIHHWDLDRGFWINTFRPSWRCFIDVVPATRGKYLQQSGYFIMIDCGFTFFSRNVFGCFRNLIAQFELLKHKFQNFTT